MSLHTLIQGLKKREQIDKDFLHITAYENQLSPTARNFLSSQLSNRYYFGGGVDGFIDWNPFTCLGLPEINTLVDEASEAAKKMLGAKSIELRCLSGVHAMMSSLLSLSDPGDTIMIVHQADGGHFATKNILTRTGRKFVYAPFNLETLDFDHRKLKETFMKTRCKVIYLDISYYISPINLRALRRAVGEQAIIIYDASHTVGLMMGGQFQSPLLEGADVICANTHKTLPGPQKGLMAFRDKRLADRVGSVIDSGLVSSSHTHHLIALAITLLETKQFGRSYAKQIVVNSNRLGKELELLGHEVRKIGKTYSYNHQVHLYIDKLGDRVTLYKRLLANNISSNFDDRLGGRLFIRIGTQELTRRQMKGGEMKQVAWLMDQALNGKKVKSQVKAFVHQFQEIGFC